MKINSKLFTNSGGQTLCHQCSTQTLSGEACYCMHMWPQTCKGILKCDNLHVQIKVLNVFFTKFSVFDKDVWEFSCDCFFQLGYTPCKAEQLLGGMMLQEKEVQKS